MANLLDIGGVILSRSARTSEIIAHNIANITTPSYKSRVLSWSGALAADARKAPAQVPEVNISTSSASSADDGGVETVDWEAGAIVQSGGALDIAIVGDGFFVVSTPDGTRYVRNGQFSRDAEGILVSAAGFPVQSTEGSAIAVSLTMAVAPDGTITDRGQIAGRLQVVDFEDPAKLLPVGNGMFDAPLGSERPMARPELRQGALEASNVSSGNEMVQLMMAMRHAETGQRVIQTYNDLMEKAITAFDRV